MTVAKFSQILQFLLLRYVTHVLPARVHNSFIQDVLESDRIPVFDSRVSARNVSNVYNRTISSNKDCIPHTRHLLAYKSSNINLVGGIRPTKSRDTRSSFEQCAKEEVETTATQVNLHNNVSSNQNHVIQIITTTFAFFPN